MLAFRNFLELDAMPTTAQILSDHPDILLQVIAELRGAFLDGADNREQAIELLSAQLTEPTSTQVAYQEVVDFSEQSQQAIETLLKAEGEVIEAQFSRDYGSIRQMGPAKLERESPWLYPENVAELLYYYGLIGRGFKGTGQEAHTVIHLPSDIVPWLPQPQDAAAEGALSIMPVPAPPKARTLLADDSFLEDAGTFLGFLRNDTLRLTASGPHPEDIDRFVQRLQLPFTDSTPELDTRLASLLHIANRLGWLRRVDGTDGPVVKLIDTRVRTFLQMTRAQQRQSLWEAWRDSAEWNDLCRTPGLECTDTGNWKNDPLQTRQSVLKLLSHLQANGWYSLSDFTETVKEHEPNFQRPTGNYNTWYIRSTNTQEFLKGFEQWDEVEGALLRFLINGPLHWLCAIDLAEPSAGDDLQFTLSQWGARWLGQDVVQPPEEARRPIVVGDDFTITLPPGTPLSDRFRAERFAIWQASYPQYVYQVNQRSIADAAEAGISTAQILEFLRKRCHQVPEKVVAGLEKFKRAD